MKSPNLTNYGDNAILVQWVTDGYDPEVTDAVNGLCAALRRRGNWLEVVPGYDCVTVQFNPLSRHIDQALAEVQTVLDSTKLTPPSPGPIIEIPVRYGGEFGPDIHRIAANAKCSIETVIQRHSAPLYRVCFIGFIPGFAFMSEAPKSLHHPRHTTPRATVPAGSIGIAGWQTGIYGLDSPGGWQIIGRTDVAMFDATRTPAFVLSAGDRVRFIPQ